MMNREIVSLWAEIGSEEYWSDAARRREFVPFKERWPQPGFVGNDYLQSLLRVVVMGQNPRASNTSKAVAGDLEMFRLIREHSRRRSNESLEELFNMMKRFMLGIGYGRAWRPITLATRHLGLRLDDIAYLNLIPLATYGDLIEGFQEPFDRATARQLKLLSPAKIVIYGKGAYETFLDLGGRKWDVNYIEQRNLERAPQVRTWLAQ